MPIALIMEAVNISQTFVGLYQTTWRNVPQDNNVNTRRRDNLKSHSPVLFFAECIIFLRV
jgi:hypothetical protein